MPFHRSRAYMSAFLAITILGSSAGSAAPAPNEINPYVVLSAMSGSTAAAESGAAEAAATQDNSNERGSMMPLWVALGVVFAGWAWILLDNDGDNDNHAPVSPN